MVTIYESWSVPAQFDPPPLPLPSSHPEQWRLTITTSINPHRNTADISLLNTHTEMAAVIGRDQCFSLLSKCK